MSMIFLKRKKELYFAIEFYKFVKIIFSFEILRFFGVEYIKMLDFIFYDAIKYSKYNKL